MSAQQRPRPLRSEEINRIRPDLDKRSPEKVAADERGARRAAERNARDEGEKKTFLSQLFGGGK